MRIKLGSIVSSVGGSLAGATFTHSGPEYFLRSKSYHTNSPSQQSSLHHSQFFTIPQMWKSLTDQQRLSFKSNACNGDDGYRLFCRLNFNRIFLGSVALSMCPSKPNMPSISRCVFNYASDSSTLELSINFFSLPSGFVACLYISDIVGLGHSSFKRNYYFLASIPCTNPLSVDMTDYFSTRYGPFNSLNTVFLKIIFFHQASGYTSISFFTKCYTVPIPANHYLPIGGTANQFLRKIDAVDYNTYWK